MFFNTYNIAVNTQGDPHIHYEMPKFYSWKSLIQIKLLSRFLRVQNPWPSCKSATWKPKERDPNPTRTSQVLRI